MDFWCRIDLFRNEKDIKSLDDDKLNYIQVFASTKTRNRKNFYKELLKYFPSDSEEPQFSKIFQILKFKNIMNRLFLLKYSIYVIIQSFVEKALSDHCISKEKRFTKSLIVLLKYIKISKYESNENLSFIIGSFFYEELYSIKKHDFFVRICQSINYINQISKDY
ncbi:hypothetical protein H8356DRAFT_1322983 [Neocallimastix lanati (nom. inval.)]|nr:hypothetical protein H8356DRAFT_1322983 [Neocallimastix sp. JGI-2020a]